MAAGAIAPARPGPELRDEAAVRLLRACLVRPQRLYDEVEVWHEAPVNLEVGSLCACREHDHEVRPSGEALGHEVAVFGEQSSEEPTVPYSLDVKGFDFVIFVVYETKDFPDLPYLARLLDGVPREPGRDRLLWALQRDDPGRTRF